MNRTLTVSVFILAAAGPALACSPAIERLLTEADHGELALYLDENIEAIDSSAPIREVASYGFGESFSANVLFAPHNVVDGVESFYSLACQHSQDNGFDCTNPKVLHSITFSNPDDYVRIDDDLSAHVGRNIIQSIRDLIVVDTAGNYEFEEWGETKKSIRPLDLIRIEYVSRGTYNVYADSDAPCTFHLIEVRAMECGLDDCSFEIISNEVFHFV